MRTEPILDRVVIRPITEETRNGIVLPVSAKPEIACGEVVAVGRGHRRDDGGFSSLLVSVGDVVQYRVFSADEVEYEGETLKVVREADILLRVRENVSHLPPLTKADIEQLVSQTVQDISGRQRIAVY